MIKKQRPPKPTTPNLASPLRVLEAHPDEGYLRALGDFVESYANTESLVFTYLHFSSKLTLPVSRALFSGVRTKEAISYIQRIWDVDPPPDFVRSHVEEAFTHLHMITDVRNHVMHYGSFLTDEQVRVTSDLGRAHTVERVRQMRIGEEDLITMTRDLFKIGIHIMAAMWVIMSGFDKRREAEFAPLLAAAWRYTQPPARNRKPRKPSSKERRTRQVPPAQPPPSQA
jgi:hypothetical protein